MAGFECTDQLNAFGNRVDFLHITGHLHHIESDFRNVSLFQMQTVREGICWSQVEKKPYQYDWSRVARVIHYAKANDIQVIWDMCHFGYPDDLTPLHPHFTTRFAALCMSFIQFYRSISPSDTLIITPINEVSFISWLGGEVAGTTPYCSGNGWDVKYALMKAYIKGIEACNMLDNNIRFLTTEPLVSIVAPLEASEAESAFAIQQHEEQFQVLDILSGKICPELGGRPEYLDILGFNYYYSNQWIAGTGTSLPWLNEIPDSRWRSLSSLLLEAYQRYQRPFILSETSHPGKERPLWIDFIAAECAIVLAYAPLWGICWYPAIDRPDWDHLTPWHRSGLWDVTDYNTLQRVVHFPTAAALLRARLLLKPYDRPNRL
ncbi:hypothetical protein FLA_3456 [Filimonas lacunae]|nr:hypothetical protein FLA_3456 [Filimonas lacunae]